MSINLKMPDIRELKPKITVCGVGGAGGNAVNNMITSGLEGVDFIVANTDAQALSSSKCERIIQMGLKVTEGLGAGSHPEVGAAAAQEVLDEIRDHLSGSHMCFITAGMGGGTGTGAAPVIAKAARELGILTVGVVTKPFQFEGVRRMRTADYGISELQSCVDTLIVIPNQNLFRVANERTTFADAFALADQVLYSGVACITDLMVKEGLINLDFADVRAVMRDMGKAMMGTGEATGERRAITAAEAAIANPLLDETSMKGARGLLISITGGNDLTLYEVDEAATRIREEVDPDANIILGATFDASLDGVIRVSVVATGIEPVNGEVAKPVPQVQTTSAVARPSVQPVAAPAPLMTAPVMAAPSAPVAAPSAQQQSLAELTEKLKQSSERLQAMSTPPRAQQAPAFEPMEITQQIPLMHTPSPEVALQKMEPRPALFREPVEVEGLRETAPPMPAADFIPPAAERPVRAPRMPTIDELPMPAQAQVRAQGQAPAQPAGEKRRTSLIERLAGMARREAEGLPAQAPAPQPVAARPAAPAPAPQAARPTAADYARRPAQAPALSARQNAGGLDMHGRPAPQARIEDEHLDIPAFLRRQSN